MDTLNHFEAGKSAFSMLSYLGFWLPNSLKSIWAIRVYNFCTVIVVLHMFYFSTTLMIYICQSNDNFEMSLENVFFFNTAFLLSLKLAYFNVRRQDVNSLVKLCLQSEYLPCNTEEDEIYRKLQDEERFVEHIFMISTLVANTFFFSMPLISRKPTSFPMKRWNPYAINSQSVFWITYIYDAITIYTMCLTYASLESLLIIFMLRICTNIDIFVNRLLKLQIIRQNTVEKINFYQQECQVLKSCVNFHRHIFVMENALNDMFSNVVFLQFFVSILNLCTSGFCLTKAKLNNGHTWFLMMMSMCHLIQIFIYCYIGEILTKKSLSVADEIYKMDWTALTKQTKENLMLIMMRSNQPMQLTGGSVITLSTDTFLKVMKASYSSFNLLKQSR